VGGHLALELLLTNWQEEYGLPADVVKGATSISGLYDLRPIAYSYVQEYAFLSPRESDRLSPINKVRPVLSPLVLTVGSLEPEGFVRQMREFAHAWKIVGNVAETITIEGANHLTTFAALSRSDGAIVRAVLQQMALHPPSPVGASPP
jgi:arylformamidase